MGLTERHWFEDEESELTERQLEDVVSIQDRVYRRGYHKGYSDGVKEQEEQIKNHDESLEKAREEIKWLRGMLKEQEVRELTMDEWQEWKNNLKRNPICELWEHDTSPIWVLNSNDVHEPALLMGKLKLFTGKPTFEQCKAVKWE